MDFIHQRKKEIYSLPFCNMSTVSMSVTTQVCAWILSDHRAVLDHCDTHTCSSWAGRFDFSPCYSWHCIPPLDHYTNYIFINSSTSSWVVGWLSKSSLSLSHSAPSSSARTHSTALPAIPQWAWAAIHGSSPCVFTNTNHRNPPDGPKTVRERREREAGTSCALWLQQLITIMFGLGRLQSSKCVLVLLSLLSFTFWFGLKLCHLWGNCLRPQCNEGCRNTAGCGGQSLSLILESCERGDPSCSINLAWRKQYTMLNSPWHRTNSFSPQTQE